MSVVQSRSALAVANDSRSAGARAKRRAAVEGLPAVVEMLASGEADSLRVHDLLEAVPRIGVVKTRKILTGLRIWPLKRVRELTQRQHGELVTVLEWWQRR